MQICTVAVFTAPLRKVCTGHVEPGEMRQQGRNTNLSGQTHPFTHRLQYIGSDDSVLGLVGV